MNPFTYHLLAVISCFLACLIVGSLLLDSDEKDQ